jgi:ABC-type nitrate/sulfonate/bicarbonate transport system substrate-binding protein
VRKVVIRKLKDQTNTADSKEETDEIEELLAWIDRNPVRLPEIRKEMNPEEDLDPPEEYRQDIYSLEATSTYMYHKIFVDRSYSMGKKMLELVGESKEELQSCSPE